jgi:hypothetical protein
MELATPVDAAGAVAATDVVTVIDVDPDPPAYLNTLAWSGAYDAVRLSVPVGSDPAGTDIVDTPAVSNTGPES